MAKKERHNNNHIKEIFCAENGYLSSKRVLGIVVLLACTTCILIEAFTSGISDNIRILIEYLIVTSSSLVGVTAISNIFKHNHKED